MTNVLSAILFLAVHLQLQNMSIFVSFPFIWRLLQFFTGSGEDSEKRVETTTSAIQTGTDALPDDMIDSSDADELWIPAEVGIT